MVSGLSHNRQDDSLPHGCDIAQKEPPGAAGPATVDGRDVTSAAPRVVLFVMTTRSNRRAMHTSIVGRDRAFMRYDRRKTPQEQSLTARPLPWRSLRDRRRCDPAAAAPGPILEQWLRHG